MFNKLKYQCIALLCICIATGLMLNASAQTIDFATPVTMHYDGAHLDRVLDDLSARYGVGFSYSRQIIPVHQRIYIHADGVPFGQAMESLFAQTQVIYGVIGSQLVLSVDAQKVPRYPDLGYHKGKRDDSLVASEQSPRMYYDITPLSWQTPVLQYASSRITYEEVAYDLKTQIQHAELKTASVRAQVTLVPPLSADTDPHGDAPVNFSLNVIGGMNPAVQGVELGGLVNVTSDQMKGFQAAGLVNVVGDHIDGFQTAGLVNVVKQDSRGMQAAGLVNVAGGGIHGQAAGLTNISRGTVQGQAAGLFNIAQDVNGAQVSLLNVARNARGVQIGLFNFADSTSAIPIGLVSFARRGGYHSLELGVEDAIDYNLNIRLGVRSFYNILHVGLDQDGENWSLGYGIGTSIWLAARNYLQFELMSRQVNEGEPWTSELNLLTQFKMSYDFALGKNIRFVIGPSFNVATSRRYDADTDVYGTDVPRYTIFDHTYNDGYRTPINVKYWVGLQAGIRFGSAETLPYRRKRN
jgi:hypothetical protein